jgi:hypothetical protein
MIERGLRIEQTPKHTKYGRAKRPHNHIYIIYNITHYTHIPLGYPWDIQPSWFILSGGFYYIDGLQTALSGAVRGTGQQQKGARICAAWRGRLLGVAVS